MKNYEKSQTSESKPQKEWSQELQDSLVQSALKEAAEANRPKKPEK